MRARKAVVVVTLLFATMCAPAVAHAGGNDLIGDEGPGCAAGAERHSGTLKVQAFLTQQVVVAYNWCEGQDNVIKWWQKPSITVQSNIPFGGAFEKVSVDNLTNTAVERFLPEIAEYKFNVLQEIARPSGAAQRFELVIRINGTVDLTTLCTGKLCDKQAD